MNRHMKEIVMSYDSFDYVLLLVELYKLYHMGVKNSVMYLFFNKFNVYSVSETVSVGKISVG